MAKKGAAAAPQAITVSYDLFDLPTAQHKAGLAGLVLQICSMRERGTPPESIPEVEELTSTSARIRFGESSLQGLFNDLYDAQIVEVAVESKWPGKTPKREEIIKRRNQKPAKSKGPSGSSMTWFSQRARFSVNTSRMKTAFGSNFGGRCYGPSRAAS